MEFGLPLGIFDLSKCSNSCNRRSQNCSVSTGNEYTFGTAKNIQHQRNIDDGTKIPTFLLSDYVKETSRCGSITPAILDNLKKLTI